MIELAPLFANEEIQLFLGEKRPLIANGNDSLFANTAYKYTGGDFAQGTRQNISPNARQNGELTTRI